VTSPVQKTDPEVLAAIRALTQRLLSKEEYEALAAVPISDDERAEKLALIEWFTRRYPTPAARLAYIRRAYASWTRAA
jgi:hypothetical protein